MNKKISTKFAFGIILAIIFVILLIIRPETIAKKDQTATTAPSKTSSIPFPVGMEQRESCQKDLRTCPDGSSIGRLGSDCEFEKCTETKSDCERLENYDDIHNITHWKTYKSTKLDIQFEYPSDLFYVAESEFEGRVHILFVKNGCEENKVPINLYIYSCSDDFVSVMGDRCIFNNISTLNDLCKIESVYNNEGDVCKITKINRHAVVISNEFSASDGSFSFNSSWIMKNVANKKYKWISLNAILPDVNTNIGKYWDDEKAYSVAKEESKNIINKKGLSTSDFNFLNIAERILNSVKFID